MPRLSCRGCRGGCDVKDVVVVGWCWQWRGYGSGVVVWLPEHGRNLAEIWSAKREPPAGVAATASMVVERQWCGCGDDGGSGDDVLRW
nr:hypothetical protein [Tanacetum cinerariifolium]